MNYIRKITPNNKNYMPLCGVVCAWICMLVFSSLPRCTGQDQLGPVEDDKVTDELFADVGKVYIETFRIDGLNATLDVKIEDTQDIDEYWLLDFQPYQYNDDNPPISEVTAYLAASHTGQCSSVEQDQAWADGYFDDDFFQNHTATGDKLLFTDFTRGNAIQNGRRSDDVQFIGGLDTFMTCQRTDGSDIWQSSVYEEEIEFTTTLYATNLRPLFNWQPDTSLQIPAVGFVQGSIHLIWRLARTAIVNFIITSEVIEHFELFALFDYGIVEPVLFADGTPDIEHTRLYMGFSTYVPIEDSVMLVWIDNTVTYAPLNPENALTEVVADPPSVLADTPLCNTVSDPDFCIQSWDYEFVLLLDISQLSVDMPLDATGAFGFDFNLYECGDVAAGTGCGLKADIEEPFNVLIDLTLQSTVSALDEAGDGIEVEVTGVSNDAGEDVRNGAVHDKENVTVEVVFYPAFLREEYGLELQLFMVCKGEELAEDTQGCLAAPEEERFTSFISDDFTFTYDASEDPNYVLNPTTPPPPGYRPGWSEWGFWTDCSKTCGLGTRRRDRVCESDSPEVDCLGDSREHGRCTMPGCNLYTHDDGRVLRYENSDRPMDQDLSESYCTDRGGRLANINSNGLQRHLLKQFGDRTYPRQIPLIGLQASQLSGTTDFPAYKAIDGDILSPARSDDPEELQSQWWKVDLNQEYCISKVTLMSRFPFLTGLLTDAIVRIGNHSEDLDDNLQCGSPVSQHNMFEDDVLCDQPICGQYVSVHSSVNSSALSLTEVWIYGFSTEYNIDDACLESSQVGWTVQDGPMIASDEYITLVMISQVIPCDGLITTWNFWANSSAPLTLIVWRPVDSKRFEVVGANYIESTDVGLNNYLVPESEFIHTRKGDVLGLAWDDPVVVNSDLLDGSPYKWMNNSGIIGGYITGGIYSTDGSLEGLSFSLSATVEPYPEVLPHYWIGGHDVNGCSPSDVTSVSNFDVGESAPSCLILSECDEPIQVPCDQSLQAICEYDDVLVFHAVSGNSENVLELWESSESHESYSRVHAGQHYKGQLVEDWDQQIIAVDEVKIVLQKYGADVLEMTFDGSGTTKDDWFTKDRLISWPYQEITNYNSFSILAFHDQGNPYRHFYINQRFGACRNDVGWLVVLEEQPESFSGCAYELAVPPKKPAFLYSSGPSATNWLEASTADSFLIYITYREKVVAEPARFDLAFRGVAGSGESMLSLWQSPNYSDSAGRITFGQHYKSALVEMWDRAEITVEEVRVQLRRDGDKVLEMKFDGQGTDKYTWFTASRVIESPFSELDGQHNYFDVNGHQGINRHFFINQFYNGCANDEGWFVVLDHGDYKPCKWDKAYAKYPQILYSNTPDGAPTNWERGNIGIADEFLVFLKYEKIPITPEPPTYPPPVEYTPDNVTPTLAGRELTSAEYDTDKNVHESKFMNRPLANERVRTTMTAVYLLVPLNERRKRDIRHRRSLVASMELPQLQSITFGNSGCPPYSNFNPLEFSCECWEGYWYNLKTFTCDREGQDDLVALVESPSDVAKNETVADEEVGRGKSSGTSTLSYNICYMCLSLVVGCWFLLRRDNL